MTSRGSVPRRPPEHAAARTVLEKLAAQVPAGGRQEEVVQDLLARLAENQ